MRKYNIIALISSIICAIVLIVSTAYGGTMFGYAYTEDTTIYKLQHLYPLTYCFGALVIYCAWRCKSKLYAVVGLLEMLFIPLLLGLIFNDPNSMFIVGWSFIALFCSSGKPNEKKEAKFIQKWKILI